MFAHALVKSFDEVLNGYGIDFIAYLNNDIPDLGFTEDGLKFYNEYNEFSVNLDGSFCYILNQTASCHYHKKFTTSNAVEFYFVEENFIENKLDDKIPKKISLARDKMCFTTEYNKLYCNNISYEANSNITVKNAQPLKSYITYNTYEEHK